MKKKHKKGICADGRRIRVVHVLSDRNIGGAGKQLYYLLSAADHSEFEYSVILPTGSAAAPLIRSTGVEVTESDYACAEYSPKAIRELFRVFREIKPDIVHTHSSVNARIAAAKARVPVKILTKHCSDLPPRAMRVFPVKTACRLHWALTLSGAIATDDSAAAALRSCGVPKKKTVTVYNGSLPLRRADEKECSALRRRLGIPEGAYVSGLFARLEPVKGVENLLRTAALCLRQTGNLYFLIVGKGSAEEKLRELAVRYGIADRVIFAGFAEDVSAYMSLCSLNLNCSLGTETSNLAAIEGMSIGVMPVMTDTGGSKRLCEGRGVCVPADDPPAMAEAIMSLLRDPGQIACMSERCKNDWKNRYTAQRMASETEAFYKSFIIN